MKLLVITQALDTEHPILGFFHRWVAEFSLHCEQVHVICLEEGIHSLPPNVIVYSLGKEKGKGKLVRLMRFYSLLWSLRNEYDSVFVHMNQIYVILGAPLWRLLKKKTGLWYAHGTVSRSLIRAEKKADVIFTCSPESFRVPSKKVQVVGHGIDTTHFVPQAVSKDIDLVTVGRISPAKNLDTLVSQLSNIRHTHPVTLTIVGKAVTEAEKTYEQALRQQVADAGLSSDVVFLGAVPQAKLPELLNRAKVFVTVAKNGSLDKAILEAMACGVPVVSMAEGSASLPLGSAHTGTLEQFTEEAKKVLESGVFTRPEYVSYIAQNHSLQGLIPKIISKLS